MNCIAMTGRLRREICALDNLTREELVERWHKAHGCPPPKGIKRNLLLRSAAWYLQAKRLGGLKSNVKRTLQKLMKTNVTPTPVVGAINVSRPAKSGRKPVRHLRGKLAPGVRLVREWNGRLYVVEVVEDGFQHDNKMYRSLSAVAQRITGTNWSGPRFFGL